MHLFGKMPSPLPRCIQGICEAIKTSIAVKGDIEFEDLAELAAFINAVDTAELCVVYAALSLPILVLGFWRVFVKKDR